MLQGLDFPGSAVFLRQENASGINEYTYKETYICYNDFNHRMRGEVYVPDYFGAIFYAISIAK